MKFIILICLICSFSLAFSSEKELPSEVQWLVSKRKEAVAKVDQAFVEELEKLKVKYTKTGDLEKANLVVTLIKQTKSIDGEEKISLDGKWLVNEKVTRTFSGNTMIDQDGKQHSWAYQNGVITIQIGKSWEKLQFDPKNPDVLKGVNNSGTPHVYKRISN